MKKILVICILSFGFFNNGNAQNVKSPSSSESELNTVLSTFMDCLVSKDSVKFYNLFIDGPVAWSGIYYEKSQRTRGKSDKAISSNYFLSDYKSFFRSISGEGYYEEKFYNISIKHDGYVAAVTFDYSFWKNSKKLNWGKESWALIKADGKWKIASVIFSMELESVFPEPDRVFNEFNSK